MAARTSCHPLRAAVLSGFTVDVCGRIKDPGRFHGEMVYVPHFYASAPEGGLSKAEADGVMEFDVSPDERAAFPELGGRRRVWITETGDGFVCEAIPGEPVYEVVR